MGAGAFTSAIQGCEQPDYGSFVDHVIAATDPVCATAHLNPGEHFIASNNGGAQNTFTGDITDVFRCIAQVGTSGCGFEQHLEAVRAALGDATADPAHDIPVRAVPPNNTGFLREDAYLAVIFITNEEECSTAPDNVLFDTGLAAPATLGPLQARCSSHTDICDGQPVINYVQAGRLAGPFQSCVPDETTFSVDPKHAPIPVQFYIDYMKKLKADPTKLLLSGIIAPDGPLQGNSCTGLAGVFGQPVPRWTKFFGAFGAQQAVTTSICDQSFSAAMQQIAELLARSIGEPCVSGTVLDVMGPMGARPDCTVLDHTTDSTGTEVDTVVPSCVDNGDEGPCWSLVPGSAAQCSGQQMMLFTRPANQPAPTVLNTSVECSIAACVPGVHNSPSCP